MPSTHSRQGNLRGYGFDGCIAWQALDTGLQLTIIRANSTHHASASGMRTEVGHFFTRLVWMALELALTFAEPDRASLGLPALWHATRSGLECRGQHFELSEGEGFPEVTPVETSRLRGRRSRNGPGLKMSVFNHRIRRPCFLYTILESQSIFRFFPRITSLYNWFRSLRMPMGS